MKLSRNVVYTREHTMGPCPPRERLEGMLASRLSDVDRQAVETHLQRCPDCQQTLLQIADTSTTQVGDLSRPAPPPNDLSQLPAGLREHPRYQVVELLGAGGMGTVYRANHRILERPVVLKVILKELIHDAEMVERFRREAKLAARLSHANIVTLYEAEEIGSTHVMVMEYVDGVDLERLVFKRGPLPIAAACEIARQAALGLQHASERGLVHRDIKPSNLLLSHDGTIKLLDMGLAVLKNEQGGGRLTSKSQILGTLDYMAPEQWQDSHTVDIRADIYSLGCTLYELLAGQPPFAGDEFTSPMKQMWAHSHKPVPPIRDLRPDVPAELVAVLDRMLAKDPAKRFATPAEVAAALDPLTTGADLPPLLGKPSSPRTRISSTVMVAPSSRRPLWPWLAGALALLAVTAGLVVWFSRGPEEPHDDAKSHTPVFTGPPIKVGILHSQSGTMSISERPVLDATLVAIEEINEKGGVLGREVKWVAPDGQSDDQVFARQAEKLITQDKVATIFGCWTSSSRKAVKDVVEKHDHLLVYPLQYEGLETSPNIIYTGAAPNQQILPAVRWCRRTLRKERFFLIGSDYVFPRAASAIIRDELKELGGEIVGEEFLLMGNTEVEPFVKKIAASKADMILNLINGDSNVPFFRELRTAGISPAKMPTISFSITENVLRNLSARDITGDYAAWNYFQAIERPQNQEFVRRMRDRFGPGRSVTDPMEAAYFGVHLWAQAVRDAGSDDVKAIRQKIRGQSYDAPEGMVRIDPATGHTEKTVRIGQITEDGQFEVVYSSERPIPPVPFPPSRSEKEWKALLQNLYEGWGKQWANPGR